MLDLAAIGVVSGAALLGAASIQAVRSASGRPVRKRRAAARDIPQGRRFDDQLDAALRWARASQPAYKAWSGTRTFCVSAVVDECDDCRSYYLVPQDGRPLPRFEPGQYLTFHLPASPTNRPVVRCYSLSERPRDDYYRVTIQRVGAPRDRPNLPPGAASNFFHRQLSPGSCVEAEAPQGAFFLDPGDRLPIVLVGAGIGVTPLVSMASALAHTGDARPVYFFAGFRHRGQHPLATQIRQIAAQMPRMKLDVAYSRPRSDDAAGQNYHHRGRADLERLKQILPSNNFRFYLCGPPAMMESLAPALLQWGVPADHIHFEAFGPATVRRFGATNSSTPCQVQFARSGRAIAWQGNEASLLELAERHGIQMEAGCRAGNCGQCRLNILAGEVRHVKPPGIALLQGECLACIATPNGDVVVEG